METVEQNWFEEKPVDQVTVNDVDKLCEEYSKIRSEADELKLKLSELNKTMESYEAKIVQYLEELGKTSWKAVGKTFIVATRLSVTTPKEPSAKEQFFNYLKERGVFEDMVSVNYQTLNAFYKTEMEHAIEGGDVNFKMPGIGEPTYTSILQMRSK